MNHSGDLKTEYGLEHIIHVDPDNFVKGFVISAPWLSGKTKPIKTLIDTNPILEIRTEDGNILRRYIIPQDYSEASNKTACVNAEISYDGGMWTVKIRRDFIMGFADDRNLLMREVSIL